MFQELPDTGLLICVSVYPPFHSSYEELESLKMFVGTQTKLCYANTDLLWCRMLSAGRNRTAAKLTVACVIGEGAGDVSWTQ